MPCSRRRERYCLSSPSKNSQNGTLRAISATLTVMGGAADRELDEAKRLRSIENGPVVDVTAVAQGLSEKAEGSVNNG